MSEAPYIWGVGRRKSAVARVRLYPGTGSITVNGRSARDYSRAYLHHLIRSGEALGAMLLSEINIAYYQSLMHDARAAIAAGTFADFRDRTRAGWARGDIAPR